MTGGVAGGVIGAVSGEVVGAAGTVTVAAGLPAGSTVEAAAGLPLSRRSRMETLSGWLRAVIMPSPRLVIMNRVASIAVARVTALAAARPESKLVDELPDSPMPSLALRCIRIIPMRNAVTRTWIVSKTLYILSLPIAPPL